MKSLSMILMLAAFAGGTAYADCSYPMPPDHVPDGNTATLQEMLAGQSAFQAYNAEVKAYQDCLRLEHDQALSTSDPSKMTPDQKAAYDKQKAALDNVLIQKNDAAVDAATAATNRFNEQVKIFKEKHKKS
jgi:hypothetical protein